MLRIGVVGVSGGWSTERLLECVRKGTGSAVLVEMEKTRLVFPEGDLWAGEVNLRQLDALIVKKVGAVYSTVLEDRLEMLRIVAQSGVRVFSDPVAIARSLNRLSGTVTLQIGGIPMPPTVITQNAAEARDVVHQFGRAVFKPLYSTKARGMEVMDPGNATDAAIKAFQSDNPILYIQKLVDYPGRDLGVVFCGGDYLCTYARVREEGNWTTSTAFGGRYEPYAPSTEILDLSYRAQALFGLDFTCVDVVETSDGPMVYEVSAFGGFKGITRTSDIDPAQRYLDHVLGQLRAGAVQ